MHINVKTTSPDLSFRVQKKRVGFCKTTPVILDSVVKSHIKDGSLIIVENNVEIGEDL